MESQRVRHACKQREGCTGEHLAYPKPSELLLYTLLVSVYSFLTPQTPPLPVLTQISPRGLTRSHLLLQPHQRSTGVTYTLRIHNLYAAFHPPACMHAKLLQSCPTLCNPKDCSLSGSSVHGILQASVLEWVAIAFS